MHIVMNFGQEQLHFRKVLLHWELNTYRHSSLVFAEMTVWSANGYKADGLSAFCTAVAAETSARVVTTGTNYT
jgi:hypothetical protein